MKSLSFESMPPTPLAGRPLRSAGLLPTLCLLTCGLLPATAHAAPPTPSKPVAVCDATVGTKCYVGGSFSISSSSPGADHYKVCRSNDTTGWGGCNKTMTTNTGSSYTVSGSHLPSDGFRRAYYFSACDASNSCTSWGANPEAYVYMDSSGPTAPGATQVSCDYDGSGCWTKGQFTVWVSPASDSGSGVGSHKICRSNDSTGGHAGCHHNIPHDGSTSFEVSGTDLPSRGFRRSYWFKALDQVGNVGLWNSPRYVRVDYDDPTLSANNASSSWFTSRTATITAADDTNGAAANSGLKEVRYRWNTAHNGSCTTGTVTTSGATLTVPEGDNHLYLCAKDNVGRVGLWNGGPYRVDSGAPVQSSLGVSDDVWIIDDGEIYDITAKVTDSVSGLREVRTLINYQGSNKDNRRGYFSWRDPSFSYQWTADRVACTGGGFASKHPTNYNPSTITLVGCTTSKSGDQRTVTFKVRPEVSFEEFGSINDISLWARDFALNKALWTQYDLNFRSRLKVDETPPSLDSLTISSSTWVVDDGSTYDITLKATDLGSGVREVRALVNYQGSNSADPRGYFSWRDESVGYMWTGDRVQCTNGGLASKHPDLFNPTTITLVGCTTSTDDVERTVTFTVKPNATFGKYGLINDISVWARDFDLNSSPSWQNFDLNFSSSRPGDRQGRYLGYAGVTDPGTLGTVQAFGIQANSAFIIYQWDPTATYYWRDLDTGGMVDNYQQLGARPILSIENILFERINMPSDSTCVQVYRTDTIRSRLRADWYQLLDEFNTLHGDAIRGGGVEEILVASEVNNTCSLMSEVETAAARVKQLFPSTPLGMAYAQTYNKAGVRLSEPPPSYFPAIFDGIGIWSYNTFDPNNPLETRNATFLATEKFYNPQNPQDGGTIYGNLLAKLHPGQEVYLVFDALWNPERGDLGWQPEDLGEVAENWAEFMAHRPEAVSMIGYIWHSGKANFLGMDELPGSVIGEHGELACRYFGLRPPGSTNACLLDP